MGFGGQPVVPTGPFRELKVNNGQPTAAQMAAAGGGAGGGAGTLQSAIAAITGSGAPTSTGSAILDQSRAAAAPGGSPAATGASGGSSFAATPPTGQVPGAPAATNVTAPDATLTGFIDDYKKRLAQLQQPNTQDPALTAAAISSARGSIQDQAAGAQEAAGARLAAQGRSGGGGETIARTRIAEAGDRAANKAASDISLQRARDAETDQLQRDQMQNSFLLGGQSLATAPANLALQQQGLNLSQQLGLGNLQLGEENAQLGRDNFTAGRDDSKLSSLLALLKMVPSYGASY